MTRHEERVREILAESWLDGDSAEELVDYLSALEQYVDDHPPEPGPHLAALMAARARGVVGAPSARRRGSLLVAATLTVGTMGVGGVAAAAANELPTGAQHLVAQLSERFLPFDLPRPDEVLPQTARPAASVDPGGRAPETPPVGREVEGLDDRHEATSGGSTTERARTSTSANPRSSTSAPSPDAGPREKTVPGAAPQAGGAPPKTLDEGTEPVGPATAGDVPAGTGDTGAVPGDPPAMSGDLPAGAGEGTPVPEPKPTPGETAGGQPEPAAAPESDVGPALESSPVPSAKSNPAPVAKGDAGPAAKGDAGPAAKGGRADPSESQRGKKKGRGTGVGVGAGSGR